MMRKINYILVFLVLELFTAIARAENSLPPFAQIEAIKPKDRIIVFAPHPDDEAIACAGLIQEAVRAGADLRVVYLTNGDHNQVAFIVYEKRLTFRKGEFLHMGEVRRKEAIKAMQLLGLSEDKLIFLGYPDFGTYNIFMNYWQSPRPFKSLLTRVTSVPYQSNYSFGAPYVGESILEDLKKILKDFQPNKIFVSHPADTNGDHKALYLFLQIALADLDQLFAGPRVYPYLVHHAGWPLPRHYHPRLFLAPPESFSRSQIRWCQYRLDPGELEKKHQAILCYKSQTESSAFYLLAFARRNELFGDYPEVYAPRLGHIPEVKKLPTWKEGFLSFFKSFREYPKLNNNSGSIMSTAVGYQGQVSYVLAGNSLLIRVEKNPEITRKPHLAFYLYGYNYKTPFAQMPKLRIIVQKNKLKVFNKRRPVTAVGMSVEPGEDDLILKVPLYALGNPDFILVALRAYAGLLPVDAIGFRRVNIDTLGVYSSGNAP